MPVDQQRLERLNKARNNAKELMTKPPARWENECETVFSEFRISCVHVRKDTDTLDAVEDKQAAWRFICKMCRERPFQHDRCNEVLRILMLSEAWVKAFIEDPEADVKDLPPNIADTFTKRIEEVDPDAVDPESRGAGGADPASQRLPNAAVTPGVRDPTPPAPPEIDITRPAGMAVVVQRCEKAKVLVNEKHDWWGEIGRGLILSVSFANDATEDRVVGAAKFLLSAKLSTGERFGAQKGLGRPAFGSDAQSVLELCKHGEDQGILVIPQASLVADIGKKDMGLSYDKWLNKETAKSMYKVFIDTLRRTAEQAAAQSGGRVPKVVASEFEGRQLLELSSAGPFMHSFNF